MISDSGGSNAYQLMTLSTENLVADFGVYLYVCMYAQTTQWRSKGISYKTKPV